MSGTCDAMAAAAPALGSPLSFATCGGHPRDTGCAPRPLPTSSPRVQGPHLWALRVSPCASVTSNQHKDCSTWNKNNFPNTDKAAFSCDEGLTFMAYEIPFHLSECFSSGTAHRSFWKCFRAKQLGENKPVGTAGERRGQAGPAMNRQDGEFHRNHPRCQVCSHPAKRREGQARLPATTRFTLSPAGFPFG